MKTLKSILIELTLPFILSWFFMSVLIDIIAIPTVFKNISNLQEAAKIGMTVFHRFNYFEIFFGVCVLVGVILRPIKTKWMVLLSVALLIVSFIFTFYMTPMIANNSIKMHQVLVTDPMYQVLRDEHNKYHTLYRYFEMAKLFALLFFAGIMIRLNILNKESV